jgi:ergothioneine biosynthesis protein EgtB
LDIEDYLLCVTEDTSPPKWHLAHTTWFFENFILMKYLRTYASYSSEFNYLFNSYYRHVGEYLPKSSRRFITRPSVDDIYSYRKYVNTCVSLLLENADVHLLDEIEELVELGINHEQQHQELLLMDIKRNFFSNPLYPIYKNNSDPVLERPGTGEFRHLENGISFVGHDERSNKFGYDNESGRHQYFLESFCLSTELVTNEEYLEFIDAGGYENPLCWLSDGWDRKVKEDWQYPLYWIRNGSGWFHMTLGGVKPLPLTAPVVHLSYYEAQAYAHWKGCRLPTEFEWEVASHKEPILGDFLEQGNLEPTATLFKSSHFTQLHGTVWEWTQSAYLPYPRYKPLSHGLGEYNEKFMSNQFVLRGGSSITPKNHYRRTYRNFYYPHMRWQYAGLRLAKDV